MLVKGIKEWVRKQPLRGEERSGGEIRSIVGHLSASRTCLSVSLVLLLSVGLGE